jgi:hypothetical protein
MAMTGAGLAAARTTARPAATQTSDPAAAAAAAAAYMLADSTAIVQYIQQNLAVTSSGADPQGGTLISNSTVVA